MKLLKAILVLTLASTILVACKENTREKTKAELALTAAPQAKKPIAAANLKTATFAVEGMTCAVGCAKTIQEELTELEGVSKATVDFDTKLATVVYDKTTQSPAKLTQTVEAVADGKTYKVTNMKS
ncbi:heavy-metal-associated domain-containing protein [Flavobacterium sp. F-328]|uniref:Heavy-metal-associated domain-containing protein n=1 Tax=Flavobacterium erciyesense TaxID=2825842 RepID=A0ABS5CZX9_9FLAO|nr:heavy metal-associated domain-containing protein [Flavobacterium erciyesense]MBQ0907318.1 heavy-metal-associated domain-containing protein [Flavobacterium erciyesense]